MKLMNHYLLCFCQVNFYQKYSLRARTGFRLDFYENSKVSFKKISYFLPKWSKVKAKFSLYLIK
jgi:hypothetical protein